MGGPFVGMGGQARQSGGLWVQGRLCAWGWRVPALCCPCRGASGLENGLLVVNMLIDGHRGLVEQLASCDLPTVLQSCWWDGRSTGCPHAMLALHVINRFAEHQLPLGTTGRVSPAHPCHAMAPWVQWAGLPRLPGQSALLGPLKRVSGLDPGVLVVAGSGAPLDLRDMWMLLGGLRDGILSKDMVVALERQLCSEGPVSPGEAAQLLLHSFELLGVEKAVNLSILR